MLSDCLLPRCPCPSYTLINVDKNAAQFADDNGKRGRDGSIRMSVLQVPDSGPISYSVHQMMINCATLKVQTLEGVNYSRGKRPSPVPGEAEPTIIQTGTLGMVLKHYICEGIDPYPRSKTFKTLDDAVERAHELIAIEKTK